MSDNETVNLIVGSPEKPAVGITQFQFEDEKGQYLVNLYDDGMVTLKTRQDSTDIWSNGLKPVKELRWPGN